MNSIKIVHTADLHLTNPDNITVNIRRQLAIDALQVFYKIIDFCIDFKPDLLLIAGDLFSIPNESYSFSKQIFEKFLEIPDTKVMISPGNHDYLITSSPYFTDELPDNVYIFSDNMKITLEKINTNIFGAGFITRYIKESIFKPTDESELINLCIMHGDVTNSQTEYNPISGNALEKSNFDYVALGHIHSYSGIHKIGKTSYAYPGTPQGQGFDEIDEKGIIYGTISKDFTDLKFKSMCKRIFSEFSFDITESTSASETYMSILEYIKEKYGELYKDNLYKINLTGIKKENTHLYQNYIYDNLSNTLFYCEINDLTKPDLTYFKSNIDEMTVKGIFIKKMLDIIENNNDSNKKIAEKALYIGLEALDNGY